MVKWTRALRKINILAVVCFVWVRIFHKKLAIPHMSVDFLMETDPFALKKYGIEFVLFDKDNTLTLPYENTLHPTLREIFGQYKQVFGNHMAILSNSAGSSDDRGFRNADALEKSLGIKVLQHKYKKPFGIEPVQEYFGGEANKKIAIIGDGLFTDVVFGNRYQMYTIYIKKPLAAGNTFMKKMKRCEKACLKHIKL